MIFDLQAIFDSKRIRWTHMTTLPLMEKLRMLDTLRQRALTLRRARAPVTEQPIFREDTVPYQTDHRTQAPSK